MNYLNIHDTPPFIANDDNIVVSRDGNVIFCYEILLPEKHSLSEQAYDDLLKAFEKTFRPFEKDTVIHKLDYFFSKPYDAEHLPMKSYLQTTFKEHHKKKEIRIHRSYLFFIWTLNDILKKDEFTNPFAKISNEEEILKKVYDTWFPETVETQVAYVKSTKKFALRKLNSKDIEDVCCTYFNGLQAGFYTDVDGSKAKNKKQGLQVGERFADIYTVNSLKQLPQRFSNIIEDPELSDQGRPFFQGLTEPLGVNLSYDHVVNQIIYFPAHHKVLAALQGKQKEFYGSRGFGLNAGPAKKIQEFLEKLIENRNARLVKAHFNVVLFSDDEKQRRSARNSLKATFTDNDITPYVPIGNALKGIFIHSFFAFSAGIPARFKFIAQLEEALSLFIPTTTYRSDEEGVYFCDRISNAPLKRDTWDASQRRIKARNFFIIAPTGQGKSTKANHLCYQWLDQGYKLVINDLGKSYMNLYRLYKKRAAMLEYVPGEPLGINPFQVKDLSEVNTELVRYINDVINLLHFKGSYTMDEVDKQFQGHNTCIRKVIQAFYENSDELNLAYFYKFFQYIHSENRYSQIDVDPALYDARKEMGNVIFSLSEFVGDGVYSFLFQERKDLKSFEITPETDLAYFEFDRAGEDQLLLSILQLYSFEATRKVIWYDKSVRGIQLYDEYAKQLKYPQIQVSSEFVAQAIRKQNGACGFIIQSVSQLPKNDTIGSILDNTSVYYILPTEKKHTATADRLELPAHQRYLLDSIESNLHGKYPYTESFLLIGKTANVVRVQLPPEHFYAFQTDGDLYNKMEGLYKQTGNMEEVVQQMSKRFKQTA
ncbi:MAG: hypothetical protein AAGA64_08685 [Bacteroidota bacterium]